MVPGADQLSIMCVPARDEADELAGMMLCQILRQSGFRAEAVPTDFVEELLTKVAECQPDVLFVSALPPFAINHARALCRRARQRCPGLKAAVGLWAPTTNREDEQRRLGSGCSDYIVHNLQEAQLQARMLAEQRNPAKEVTIEEPAAPQMQPA